MVFARTFSWISWIVVGWSASLAGGQEDQGEPFDRSGSPPTPNVQIFGKIDGHLRHPVEGATIFVLSVVGALR